MNIVRKVGYNYTINGLRGLCILMVFIYHIENSNFIPSTFDDNVFFEGLRYFTTSFKYGVEIFFMISGYVIYHSLKRHKTFFAFLTDRFMRIFPTWLPLHLLSFIAGPFIARGIFEHNDHLNWFITFWADLFFLSPILPFDLVHPAAWSLSYEWAFYLLSGFVTFLIARRFGPVSTKILAIILAIIFVNFFPRALFFIPGIVVALREDELKNNLNRYIISPGIMMVFFLLVWLQTGANRAEIGWDSLLGWTYDMRIFYALSALVIACYMFAGMIIEKGFLSRLLQKSIFQFLGNISFAFYLWSPICLMISKIIAKQSQPYFGEWASLAIFIIFGFISSLLISYLNWKLIEDKLTKRLKMHFNSKQAVSA